MSFSAESAAMAHASRMVADLADDVRREHERLGGEVSGLLGGGWSGVAADQYSRAWQQWCDGMLKILAGLHTESQLIAQSQAAYESSDADATGRMQPLASRLQSRLG